MALNFTQIIESCTHLNPKCPDKSSLIDLLITNMPHKYSATGVFANDLSDHCVAGAVRNIKIPHSKPCIINKRNLKHFSEQAFLHDLFYFNWGRILVIDDTNFAWKYFYDNFSYFTDKHAPFHPLRVKDHESPWFTSELANLLQKRNQIWAVARKSDSEAVDSFAVSDKPEMKPQSEHSAQLLEATNTLLLPALCLTKYLIVNQMVNQPVFAL